MSASDSGPICLCDYGSSGRFCSDASPVATPFFAGTHLPALASYLEYPPLRRRLAYLAFQVTFRVDEIDVDVGRAMLLLYVGSLRSGEYLFHSLSESVRYQRG